MTKKMQKIVDTYKENLDTAVWMYANNFKTFEEAAEEIAEQNKDFNNLRELMYSYNLLSSNDLRETCHTGSSLRQEAYDKLLDIKYA